MASVFITHGGGPMPIIYKQEHLQMYKQFATIQKLFPNPKAIIIFSAHWQQDEWTILDKDNPGLYFDYGGFPPQSYQYKYPAQSNSQQRQAVIQSIAQSGIKVSKYKGDRGYDHGVFIPLMIMYPQANIPVIQISLLKSLDPQKHFQMGKALRNLKKNGYLILGSGATIHGGFNMQNKFECSALFDKQLQNICLKDISQKQLVQNIKNWRKIKYANQFHTREEHLIPLFVNLGAAQGKQRQRWELKLMGVMLSSFIFK